MFFKNICVIVLWMKIALLALEGLKLIMSMLFIISLSDIILMILWSSCLCSKDLFDWWEFELRFYLVLLGPPQLTLIKMTTSFLWFFPEAWPVQDVSNVVSIFPLYSFDQKENSIRTNTFTWVLQKILFLFKQSWCYIPFICCGTSMAGCHDDHQWCPSSARD